MMLSRRLGSLLLLAVPIVLALGREAGADTSPVLGIRATHPAHLAFTHATIVVSPERTLEDATLVIENGRVSRVGTALPVPPGAFEIDLAGKRIYPAFIDPTTEYGIPPAPPSEPERGRGTPRYHGDRTGAVGWNDAIHAERDWVEAFAPDPEAARALHERGVAVVQSARMDGIFRGRGFVATLAPGLPNEVVVVPRALHFVAFDKGSSKQSYPSSLMGSIALVRQTLYDARWYAAARAAFEKNSAQEPPEVDRALAALAHNRAPMVFETSDELSLLRAGQISRELGLPMIHVGSQLEYRRLEEVAALEQPIILPLSFPRRPEIGTWEAQLDVPLAELRHWERAPANPAVLAERGVRFAFTGRGMAKGEDFFANLRKTLERGLAPPTALAALTTVPAELLGIGEDFGTLEKGRRACFLITEGDLLSEEDARIDQVWIDGRLASELHALTDVDFRGRYRLELGGTGYDLEIGRRFGRLQVQLVAGENKVRAGDARIEGDRLDFHADLAPFGVEERVRFTLRGEKGGFSGWARHPDDRREELVVARVGDMPKDEEGFDGGPKPDPKVLVSRLTYPSGAFGSERLPEPEDVLVQGATVWTSAEQGVLEDADLLVRGGKIVAVGKDLAVPTGARTIDARGKHVTPGIIDEHSHLAISQGVNEGSHAATSEVRIGDVLDPDDVGIYRALAGGVTAAQLLHGSANPIGGQAQVIKLRWGRGAEGLKFDAAPPTIKFALGENVKQSNWGDNVRSRYPQTRMGVETLMRDRFLAARSYRDEQKAWQALAPGERARRVPPRRDLQLEALVEILEGERFVHCHSYVQSEILTMLRLAEELGFKLQTFTHILEGYKVAPEMAAHGTTASSFSDWWAYKFEVYDAIPYNTCLLARAGVVTSINSDSEEMIRRLNQEAGKSVMYCGMEPAEALELATLNPAIQLRIDDRVGSLEPGKDADFVIWNGNPLQVTSRAEQTWIDGTLTWSRERDAELRAAAAKERQALIEKALATREPDEPKGGGERGPGRRWHEEENWHCEDVEDVWHARDRF